MLGDNTRPPGKSATLQDEVQAVLGRTLTGEPPSAAMHWTGRAMAASRGLSLTTVQRSWRSHHLQPHRMRTFTHLSDPHFSVKLDDVVMPYMRRPATRLCCLSARRARFRRWIAHSRDCRTTPASARPTPTSMSATTLFVTLNTLEGTAVGRCAPCHRHEKLIAFFDLIENPVPAGKVVHAVMDNHGTHKHPEVMAWLADNPRWTFHFTPTSCSWLDAGDALSPS